MWPSYSFYKIGVIVPNLLVRDSRLNGVLEAELSDQHLCFPQYIILLPGWKVRCTHKNCQARDFPGGPLVKNLPANAGDMGSIPPSGRFHMLQSN